MVDAEFTKREKRTVLAAACLAIFINPMVGTMLNLALVAIGEDFQCSTHQLGWLTSVFFISSVMAMMPAAKLSDIYGKKRIFTTGILICSAGLVLSSLSRDIYMLYCFRAFTGFGTAMISCNSVSMISDVYKRRERGVALSINTACVYLGASLGPSIGGLVTDILGWRALFLIILPMMAAALLCICGFKHNITSTPGMRMDSKGSAVYAAAVLATMLGLISLPDLYAVGLIVVGAVVMVAFVRVEMSSENPVIDMRMFRNGPFTRSLVALFLNYAASYCINFFLALYLQSIGAMTATQAGLVLMVQPVFQVVLTLGVGRYIDSLDYRILPTVGMGVLCAGLGMMMLLGEDINVPYTVLCLAVNGIGFGLFSSPNTTATMSYVDPKQYNEASGLIATLRQTGMMMSMGLATCLISLFMGSTASLTPENYLLFMDVMKWAWVVCLAFGGIGMFFSWFRGSMEAAEQV